MMDADLRQKAENLLARYCWGVDERQHEVVASCFTAEGSWVGHVAGEAAVIGPYVGSVVVANWLSSLWVALDSQRRHAFVGLLPIQHDAEGDPARAVATFALVGTQRGRSVLEVTGTYSFRFAREGEEWRIVEMVASFDGPLRATGPHPKPPAATRSG
jgi:hypothetical protein